MGSTFSQVFPPHATLTEQNLSSQKGKVFIVTGGYSGIGYELVTILFRAGGTVYVAGRSEAKAQRCIEEIKVSVHDASTAGRLEYLPLQLDDLSTIKASAEAFKAKEFKLDVLWNNAGVAFPPIGSVSKQGHELQMATNCLGPLLFTRLLLPSLQKAARESPPGSVRIVWTASLLADMCAPKGGIIMAELASPPQDQTKNYAVSKVGNWLLAGQMAREVNQYGILSVVQNPGQVKSDSLRHAKWMRIASTPLLYKAKFGAYTELWAGLSPELRMENSRCYVVPWGRLHPSPREDILDALQCKEDGGTGRAEEFQKWCKEQIAEFR